MEGVCLKTEKNNIIESNKNLFVNDYEQNIKNILHKIIKDDN